MKMKKIPSPSEQEEIQSIQDGHMAGMAMGFARAVQVEREREIIESAKQSYRDSRLTPEKALCIIAELVGLDEIRQRLELIAHRGLVSEERRRKNG
jgi:hypothetical protein